MIRYTIKYTNENGPALEAFHAARASAAQVSNKCLMKIVKREGSHTEKDAIQLRTG